MAEVLPWVNLFSAVIFLVASAMSALMASRLRKAERLQMEFREMVTEGMRAAARRREGRQDADDRAGEVSH